MWCPEAEDARGGGEAFLGEEGEGGEVRAVEWSVRELILTEAEFVREDEGVVFEVGKGDVEGDVEGGDPEDEAGAEESELGFGEVVGERLGGASVFHWKGDGVWRGGWIERVIRGVGSSVLI